MNLSIVNRCNMNCSFCFQQDYMETPKRVMSFDLFKKIVDWSNYHVVGLLGGEPTLHPQFIEMSEYIIKSKKSVRLMTNLAIDNDEIINYLATADSYWYPSILVNGNCHSGTGFHKNFKKIHDANNTYFSLGYTVNGSPDTGVEDYGNLIEHIERDYTDGHDKIYELRLSFDTGALSNRDWKFEPDVSKKKFLEILKLVKSAKIRPGINFNLDCSINACYLDLDTMTEAQELFPQMDFYKQCYAPCDIMPDGSAALCSNFITKTDSPYYVEDVFKFNDYHDLNYYMNYQIKNQKKCNVCSTCDKTFMCRGFCPALQEYFLQHD